MSYQEYLRKVNELVAKKDALYNIASDKLAMGDRDGARAVYARIGEVQAVLDTLVNPNEDGAAEDLVFNS